MENSGDIVGCQEGPAMKAETVWSNSVGERLRFTVVGCCCHQVC